jgi:hypothetical protein
MHYQSQYPGGMQFPGGAPSSQSPTDPVDQDYFEPNSQSQVERLLRDDDDCDANG